MCESKKIESADDFLRGQMDCKEGVILTALQSEDYYLGFSAQYQMEQILTERSKL